MSITKFIPYPVRAIVRAGRAVVMDCRNKRVAEKEWRDRTLIVTFTINGKSFTQAICKAEFKGMQPFMIYKTACAYLLSGDKQ